MDTQMLQHCVCRPVTALRAFMVLWWFLYPMYNVYVWDVLCGIIYILATRRGGLQATTAVAVAAGAMPMLTEML